MTLKNNPEIKQIAYIEFYVANVFTAKNFFMNALKFKHLATKKENGQITYLLKQGEIVFLLTAPLERDTVLTEHLNTYGDSIKRISLWVSNVSACFESAVHHGAKPVLIPQQKNGVHTACVELFNGVEHEFLELSENLSIPGFEYEDVVDMNSMLFHIDHIALCHPADVIKDWVKFYRDAFGFSENKNEDIHSEASGMHIIIMKSPNGKINFPLVEPTSEKSPLSTYLKFNHGSGVHHIAFATDDIIEAVKHYEGYHGELRKAPATYYEEVKSSYPDLHRQINKIEPFGIMLEQDEKGVLYQIFTRPVVTRPTLFLEFIQREVCEGFGTVNIKALYETLER